MFYDNCLQHKTFIFIFFLVCVVNSRARTTGSVWLTMRRKGDKGFIFCHLSKKVLRKFVFLMYSSQRYVCFFIFMFAQDVLIKFLFLHRYPIWFKILSLKFLDLTFPFSTFSKLRYDFKPLPACVALPFLFYYLIGLSH